MKNSILSFAFVAACAAILVVGCKKDEKLPYKGQQLKLPATTFNYAQPDVPAYFQGAMTGARFGVTDDGATLGRVLFYDKKLSKNNTTACASCHLQSNAFADISRGSLGFDGGVTPRNSMSIVNVSMQKDFFWDLRENKLESMVLKPIKNHIEMGVEDLDKLVVKLAATDYYADLFKAAYGDEKVTSERIADAMSQFLRSMVSANAKVDEGQFQPQLSAVEQEGMNLFFGQALCSSCHGGRNLNEAFIGLRDTIPSFYNDGRPRANIGLDMEYADQGLGAISPGSDGIFKVPSLRNVALTGPYMHDGRFATLMDVVNHYNSNIQKHPNLDQRLRDWEGNPWRLNLNDQQKQALVAFLNTLTDNSLVTDEKFSNPFAE
ncbi:MAG: c-type cytochrome [Saprospiraceae bacterium]|nr:c-type cytochrome [Saprospiraceae bacterium]